MQGFLIVNTFPNLKSWLAVVAGENFGGGSSSYTQSPNLNQCAKLVNFKISLGPPLFFSG